MALPPEEGSFIIINPLMEKEAAVDSMLRARGGLGFVKDLLMGFVCVLISTRIHQPCGWGAWSSFCYQNKRVPLQGEQCCTKDCFRGTLVALLDVKTDILVGFSQVGSIHFMEVFDNVVFLDNVLGGVG